MEGASELREACNSLLQRCQQEQGSRGEMQAGRSRDGPGVEPGREVATHRGPALQRSSLTLPVRDKRPSAASSPGSQTVFSVSKVRGVRLEPMAGEEELVLPRPRRGSNNTYSEYFDNLLSLIDKAARDLSLAN